MKDLRKCFKTSSKPDEDKSKDHEISKQVDEIDDMPPGKPIPQEAMGFINEAEFERNIKYQTATQGTDQLISYGWHRTFQEGVRERQVKYEESQKTVSMLEELNANLQRLRKIWDDSSYFVKTSEIPNEIIQNSTDSENAAKLQPNCSLIQHFCRNPGPVQPIFYAIKGNVQY